MIIVINNKNNTSTIAAIFLNFFLSNRIHYVQVIDCLERKK